MRCSVLSRITALALATLVGFSAPGLALAHGHAHHEAGEQATVGHAHEHADATAVPKEQGPEGRALVMGANAPDNHAHPQLTLALSTRFDAPVYVAPPIPATGLTESRSDETTSLLLTAAPARASPSDAPPRQPRAPPLG